MRRKLFFMVGFFVILLVPGCIIKALLPADQSIRIHKSYIVAVNKFAFIEGNALAIANIYLPIGETYRQAFFDRIKMAGYEQ